MEFHWNGLTAKPLKAKKGRKYIRENHYSGGVSNASWTYGLFREEELVGVCAFACPCSENVRASIMGKDHKDKVCELHRLHTKDDLPPNATSWFVARCFELLKWDKPYYKVVISFADSTEGHTGTVYQALNAEYYGTTGTATFYEDQTGRLRHPRQNGENISRADAKARGWTPVKRAAKHRYLWVVAEDKREKRKIEDLINVDFFDYPSN